MSSQINTNGIDVNYPTPGQNNSTQGFRDNFSQIRTNLNITANEITDLQNKVVLKAALQNTELNNNMANTVISNCATQGFRATTYNLGSALSETVLVNVNRADVQYGTVLGNTTLQFTGWSPVNTQSNVTLKLSVSDPANTIITLPSQCVSANNNFGVTILENYAKIGNSATVTLAANVEIVEYVFSTLDCGNTITVTPVNRPQKTTQVQTRLVPPTGFPGDKLGTVAADANYLYVCTDNFSGNIIEKEVFNTFSSGNLIELEDLNDLVPNAPIIFNGELDTPTTNLVANTVYYIKTVEFGSNITVSETRVAGTAGTALAVGDTLTPLTTATSTTIVGSDIWKRIELDSW